MEKGFGYLPANQRMDPFELCSSHCTLDQGLESCGLWAKSGPWPFFFLANKYLKYFRNTAMLSHVRIVYG